VALNPALMFDFRNQDVVSDFYTFRKSTYNRESAEATRLRGVGGIAVNGDLDIPQPATASASTVTRRNASRHAEARFHKVGKGDTLYSIARKRGTSVDQICRLNNIKKTHKIRPGQILRYN